MRVKITKNLFLILFMDVVLLFCAIYFSHLIRFDFNIPKFHWGNFLFILPYLFVFKLISFYFFDLYKGMWRYTGISDLLNIIKASTTSSLCLIIMIFYVNRFDGVSRSVFIIDWCLTVFFIIGLRLATRLCFAQFPESIKISDVKNILMHMIRLNRHDMKKVIIIGAGDCGERVCRELLANTAAKSCVVGFLDDELSKYGRKIHGVPVLGQLCDLPRIIEVENINEVVIAISYTSATNMRKIVGLCKKAGTSFKIVPSIGELIDGKISVSSIRDVEYRDLLGRKPVHLDKEEIGKHLKNKTVLVTGAAGSIGTGLCKQICKYAPKNLILFERAESPLYEIDIDLKKNFPGIKITAVLGDVFNKQELEQTFKSFTPDIIFHAAAYKHVPMLEDHPWKAVENNIIGTKNLVEVSDQFNCEKFVFVSTDKAVNPCNVMGASKRVSEIIVQNQNLIKHSSTNFITVRFGNVIGSVGSVIPLFKRQIRDGGPVTVTHPNVIRYFMLIPEACQLILQAGSMGKGGEIYILDMGDPINIDTMARDLIKFSGFEPDVDIKIEYSGLRPGEKLYEELMTDQENVIPTSHNKIMVLNSERIDLKALNGSIDKLKLKASTRDGKGIRTLLQKIVPEYNPCPDQEKPTNFAPGQPPLSKDDKEYFIVETVSPVLENLQQETA